MSPKIKSRILEMANAWGTGTDTLRCLALGCIDDELSLSIQIVKANIELANRDKKFYEVGKQMRQSKKINLI